MNDLRLVVHDDPERTGQYRPVDIMIDGRRLIDELKRIEQPYADAEGSPEIAGQYHSLPIVATLLPSQRFLDARRRRSDENGKTMILVCTCGCGGCWDFVCRIEFSDSTVTWSDFEQIHRDWDYSELGKFVFDRKSYEEQFAQIPPPPSTA